MKYIEIESDAELSSFLENQEMMKSFAFQNLNFQNHLSAAIQKTFRDCIFLGCNIPAELNSCIMDDCFIFPAIPAPYNPFINSLYTRETLFSNYKTGKPESYKNTLDSIVYEHYLNSGKEADDIRETLSRRLHDHSISDALYDLINEYNEKKIVAIMGGHGLLRNDVNYAEIAGISKKLSELGYFMISGGGPGAMEATHLGAWLAGKEESDLIDSIEILSEAPSYKHELWLDKAFEVLELYPRSDYRSLGIPTWLYGHEPPTPFATDIAKYFANSVREEGLLAIAKGGVIFAPGSAGTIQEIFQDATQNHYLSYGYASPMVFLNTSYWTIERPVIPFFEQMIKDGRYENILLSKCDDGQAVVLAIEKFQAKE